MLCFGMHVLPPPQKNNAIDFWTEFRDVPLRYDDKPGYIQNHKFIRIQKRCVTSTYAMQFDCCKQKSKSSPHEKFAENMKSGQIL